MPHRDAIDHTRPHEKDGMCGKCRREFTRGERVMPAYIVEMVGPDPQNISRRGVHLFEEFELVHIDCKDPKLIKGGN